MTKKRLRITALTLAVFFSLAGISSGEKKSQKQAMPAEKVVTVYDCPACEYVSKKSGACPKDKKELKALRAVEGFVCGKCKTASPAKQKCAKCKKDMSKGYYLYTCCDHCGMKATKPSHCSKCDVDLKLKILNVK